MAKIHVRHLIERNGKFYWQPSTSLRAAGWAPRALSGSMEAAIAEAEKINDQVDAWRIGQAQVNDVPAVDTLDGLIRSYQHSAEYRKLRPSTRANDYDIQLARLSKWGGKCPITGITRRAVKDLHEKLCLKSEYTANATLRVLRLLFNYAINRGDIQINPAARPGLIDIPPRQEVWAADEVPAFISKADEMGLFNVGTAILLAVCLAQREGDILRLTWEDYQNGAFVIRQSKTGAYICVPALPILKERLNMYSNRTGLIVRSDTDNGPYSKNSFVHHFADVRKKVAEEIPAASRVKFMDLRRTAIVRLAEAGCTESQISAVSGHKIETCRRILETYLPRNSAMAAAAIQKVIAYKQAI